MPATFGIAAVSIAGKARSYAARLSCFVVTACGDGVGGNPEAGAVRAPLLPYALCLLPARTGMKPSLQRHQPSAISPYGSTTVRSVSSLKV